MQTAVLSLPDNADNARRRYAEEGYCVLQNFFPADHLQQIYDDSPDYGTCIEILTNQGFSLSGIFPVRVDRSMKLIEMDCIMVRDA